MVSGERFQYTDPKMKELVRLISDVTASLNLKPSIGFVFPKLRDIFPSVDYLAEKSAKIQVRTGFFETSPSLMLLVYSGH